MDADLGVGPAGPHARDVPGLVGGELDRHGTSVRATAEDEANRR
jgi:hypothetical protein